MPDQLSIEMAVTQASSKQFCELVSHACEICANVFAAGGTRVDIHVGHYIQNPQTNEQMWDDGIDISRDELIMLIACDANPTHGKPEQNPFAAPLWAVNTNGKASSLADILGQRLSALPGFRKQDNILSIAVPSTGPMYALSRHVGSLFAYLVNKGVFSTPFSLTRGPEYPETTQEMVKTTEMREVDEPLRGKDGNLIYDVAQDVNGKPAREPVLHPKTGRPVINPTTGEIQTQVKVVPRTQKVKREFEKLVPRIVSAQVVPVYIQVAVPAGFKINDLDDLASGVSSYDPTWMLVDVLAGKCRDKAVHRAEGF